MQSDINDCNLEENAVLENIDYFCSILMRIEFFDRRRMTREQRVLWYVTFEKYWMTKIRERAELMAYIARFWPDVFLEEKTQRWK